MGNPASEREKMRYWKGRLEKLNKPKAAPKFLHVSTNYAKVTKGDKYVKVAPGITYRKPEDKK